MNISNTDKAAVLAEALPYLQKYYNKVVVVKYGGNAMVNDALKEAVMSDIVLLSLVGIRIVLARSIRSWCACSSARAAGRSGFVGSTGR